MENKELKNKEPKEISLRQRRKAIYQRLGTPTFASRVGGTGYDKPKSLANQEGVKCVQVPTKPEHKTLTMQKPAPTKANSNVGDGESQFSARQRYMESNQRLEAPIFESRFDGKGCKTLETQPKKKNNNNDDDGVPQRERTYEEANEAAMKWMASLSGLDDHTKSKKDDRGYEPEF